MKVKLIGEPKTVLDNPMSKHDYFGWPSAARLKNGRIAVASSGFRLAHICPFGKAVMAISEDEGETYTRPMIVIDTPLDDRDCGLTPFGESGLIVTSFNNTADFQRGEALRYNGENEANYILSYLELLNKEDHQKCLGSTMRISRDNGVTFGPLIKCPATSPHGPFEAKDGKVFWVARKFSYNDDQVRNDDGEFVACYEVDTDTGAMTLLGKIPNVDDGQGTLLSCEPHAIELENGDFLCHIRVQRNTAPRVFTLYQSVSSDRGRTWSDPVAILPALGGSPAHLITHSSGVLICAYGYREKPFGVKVMFSTDFGKTWENNDDYIYVNDFTPDLGYPETVELENGDLITVFYTHTEREEGEQDKNVIHSGLKPATILQQKWRIEK